MLGEERIDTSRFKKEAHPFPFRFQVDGDEEELELQVRSLILQSNEMVIFEYLEWQFRKTWIVTSSCRLTPEILVQEEQWQTIENKLFFPNDFYFVISRRPPSLLQRFTLGTVKPGVPKIIRRKCSQSFTWLLTELQKRGQPSKVLADTCQRCEFNFHWTLVSLPWGSELELTVQSFLYWVLCLTMTVCVCTVIWGKRWLAES